MMSRPAWRFSSRAGPAARDALRAHPLSRAALVAVAFILGACAGTGDRAATGKPTATAGAPARYNLAGYPPAFRAGFNAACDAAKRHTTVIADRERYSADPQYRQGWKDGASICGR